MARVRYEGQTQKTLLGGLMFEADSVMKILSLGKDNISISPVLSGLDGHRSIAEAASREPGGAHTIRRLWFQPDRC